jgi:hypothetical protein
VVRYISPAALEQKAQEFLAAHHATPSIPIPIEEIVEFKLHLNIIPFPNLSREFDVDGFLTVASDAIYVDQRQMLNQQTRFRFTLAHEVGHWILHRDLYEGANVQDLNGYLCFYASLDESVIDDFEFQARNLAGRILLPEAQFLSAALTSLSKARKMLPSNASDKLVCGAIARLVAPGFNVHHQVAETRLWGDDLCTRLGMKGRRG